MPSEKIIHFHVKNLGKRDKEIGSERASLFGLFVGFQADPQPQCDI